MDATRSVDVVDTNMKNLATKKSKSLEAKKSVTKKSKSRDA